MGTTAGPHPIATTLRLPSVIQGDIQVNCEMEMNELTTVLASEASFLFVKNDLEQRLLASKPPKLTKSIIESNGVGIETSKMIKNKKHL